MKSYLHSCNAVNLRKSAAATQFLMSTEGNSALMRFSEVRYR
jgi:hypothetical protein